MLMFICESLSSRYKAANHSVHSDIDLIGIHPQKRGIDRVVVVTCKSWQWGFKAKWWAENAFTKKKIAGRQAWKTFREITDKHWNQAFFDTIQKYTGTQKFTYITAVTKLKGDRQEWENQPRCREQLRENPIKILTLTEVFKKFSDNNTKTPAPSDIGRLVQLLHSAEVLHVAAEDGP